MSPKKPESIREQAEQRQQEEAMRVAKSIQSPGQAKEQTRQIAKGIEKGIALYKQQQKAKARERDRARKKGPSQNLIQGSPETDSTTSEIEYDPNSPALFVAGGIFSLVALFHIMRYFLGWRLIIENFEIPMPWSLAAALVSTGLSVWMFRVARDL